MNCKMHTAATKLVKLKKFEIAIATMYASNLETGMMAIQRNFPLLAVKGGALKKSVKTLL